jgi:hypothetical protein
MSWMRWARPGRFHVAHCILDSAPNKGNISTHFFVFFNSIFQWTLCLILFFIPGGGGQSPINGKVASKAVQPPTFELTVRLVSGNDRSELLY